MTDPKTSLVERVARGIARQYATKMAMHRPGEGMLTVAMMCGYGWEGDGAHIEKFVDANWPKFEVHASASLAAIEEAGWVVVPREPTPEMRSAGESVEISVDFDEPGRDVGFAATEVWTAMISASPKADA